MNAPTYTLIVEAITEGIHKMYCDGDCQCPAAIRLAYRDVAELIATSSLRFLAPLVVEWETTANEFTQRADEAFRDGGRDIAANIWRAIADTHTRHAQQLRALLPTGEKS